MKTTKPKSTKKSKVEATVPTPEISSSREIIFQNTKEELDALTSNVAFFSGIEQLTTKFQLAAIKYAEANGIKLDIKTIFKVNQG